MLVKKRKQMSDGDCDCDPLYNLNEVEMGRRTIHEPRKGTEKKGTQTEQADRRLDKSSKKVKRAFFPSMLSSMTTSKRRQCTESDNDNVFFNVSKCLKCMS